MTFISRLTVAAAALLFTAAAVGARDHWVPDTIALGHDFENLTIALPSDSDTPCTVVRLCADSAITSHRGVLYIHGFNDYFFQAEMADSFAAHNYAFYAVDLQRYGRSLRPGQMHCDARHGLEEYFPAIDSTLAVMKRSGVETITLMGHSTGGLTAAYYMARCPGTPVADLILNSPFLAWNLGSLNKFTPLVSALGAIFPGWKLKQGESNAYSHSLLKEYHGRWDYNTQWKAISSPDVTAGWVRSITRAQDYLKSHPGCIKVPVLLMTSMRGFGGADWAPEANSADAVLDPSAIRKIGLTLPAEGATDVVVDGGLHDLFLSSPSVTRPLYRFLVRWLAAQDAANVKNRP